MGYERINSQIVPLDAVEKCIADLNSGTLEEFRLLFELLSNHGSYLAVCSSIFNN